MDRNLLFQKKLLIFVYKVFIAYFLILKSTNMKTIWSIILVGIFFLNILGCEKPKPNTINQSVFIGKWRELSPCVAGTGSCFAVQFNVNGTYFESSPAVDTGTFALTNNSASIALTGGIGTGTYGFQFMNNDSELIIQKIYTGFYPDTPLFHKDVILIKSS